MTLMKSVIGHRKFTSENRDVPSPPLTSRLMGTLPPSLRLAHPGRHVPGWQGSLRAQEGLGTGLLHAQTQPRRCGGHARTPVCPLVDLVPVRARRVTAERLASRENCQGEGTGVALWAELGHLGASGSAHPLANRRKAPEMRRALGKGLRNCGLRLPCPGAIILPHDRSWKLP